MHFQAFHLQNGSTTCRTQNMLFFNACIYTETQTAGEEKLGWPSMAMT
jgi:hypothetical protein